MLRLTKHEIALVVLFTLSLPLGNPWVRGDGVGYYAYVRSLLIERHLNFEKDWQHGNESFTMGRVGADGHVLPSQYTPTGHIANQWSVGPSILWAPFLIVTHAAVVTSDRLGARVLADGFSNPYLIAMAGATMLYGFLGLWISFRLARKYCGERWAFLATVGIWWGSSLPVYMYFNPSWSHAHSAFVDSLFLWFWHHTRERRTLWEWVLLGLISGLMVNVYYPNGVLILIPVLEAAVRYWKMWRSPERDRVSFAPLFLAHILYSGVFVIALLPTLISRKIIFGGALETGYPAPQNWAWRSPALLNVLFASDHGLLSWTPILILALIGLVLFVRAERWFAIFMIVAAVAYYLVIAVHPDWDGLSSFGNRFFVSLTPIFILGLAVMFGRLARALQEQRAALLAWTGTAVLVLWNLGLVYQWGMHLIPPRGPISWRDAAYNQVAVVPVDAARTLRGYFSHRNALMNHIEQTDVEQIKSQQSEGTATPQ